MFDFAWSELALIAVVALVVIGPKDLPRVLRTVGVWVRQARSIAREFQGSLEQMIREAELDEVKRDIQKAANIDLTRELENTVDPKGDLARAITDPTLANPLGEPVKEIAAPEPASEALPAPDAAAATIADEAPPAERLDKVAEGPVPQAENAPAETAPQESHTHA